ncbi:MAG: SMP-30/gluconolactonase/LRE family protein [SAR324 cluster bacterium]|nr:SMP-30/gluconolactonase/LRE family protein [SAR324 cluster bacterium]
MTNSVSAELIYQNYAVIGEGSLWDPENERLYWVDIMRNQVYAFDPKNNSNLGYDVKENVGTVVLREKGGLMLALKNGFASLDLETGEVEKIADPESDIPNNRFNDGKCDPQGRFWAGTMAYDSKKGAGSLYCLETDHSVSLKIKNVTISNGLIWNQSQTVFYYIDSRACSVDAYEYQAGTGAISNRRTVKSFPENGTVPDGMAIDENDFLWVAMYRGGKVLRIHPQSGETVFEVEIPGARQITSCAFGGKNLDELYITSAGQKLSEEEWKEQPNAGGLFRIKVPFKGVPSSKYKG